MHNLSLFLAAARTLLGMNIKSVATALEVSDRKITQLERDADRDDPKAEKLMLFYRDLGVIFHEVDGTVSGVSLSSDMRKMSFNFANHPRPYEKLQKLLHQFRRIRGLVYNLSLTDQTTGSPKDTLEFHAPAEVRSFLTQQVRDFIEKEGTFYLLDDKGGRIEVNQDNVEEIIYGNS